jgi:hypothetical protein
VIETAVARSGRHDAGHRRGLRKREIMRKPPLQSNTRSGMCSASSLGVRSARICADSRRA